MGSNAEIFRPTGAGMHYSLFRVFRVFRGFKKVTTAFAHSARAFPPLPSTLNFQPSTFPLFGGGTLIFLAFGGILYDYDCI